MKERHQLGEVLSDFATRHTQDYETAVSSAGRGALYELARDQVISEYSQRHHEDREQLWLSLETTLRNCSLGSLEARSRSASYLHRSSAWQPHVSFFFDKTTQHNGVELTLNTEVKLFGRDTNRINEKFDVNPKYTHDSYMAPDGFDSLRKAITDQPMARAAII